MEAPKSASNQTESKLHFLDYWRIIRIRMTVILAVFLLVALTTTAVTFMLPKKYMSTVRLEVAKETSPIIPLLGIRPESNFDPYFIQTEFEKIQSQSVLDPVIDKLDLNDIWAKRFGVDKLKTAETRRLLQRNLDVRQFRNTSLIEIRVKDEDPELAKKIAEEIGVAYQNSRLGVKTAQSKDGIAKLQEMFDVQDKRVRDLETEVDRLKAEFNISDADSGSGMPSSLLEPETVRNLERERIQAKDQFILWKVQLDKLKELDEEQLKRAIPTVPGDEHYSRLLTSLQEAQQKLAVYLKDYSENHPEVQRLKGLIQEITEEMDHRVKGVMASLEIRVASLGANLTNLTEEVTMAKERDVEAVKNARPYFQAKRDLETQQKIRDNLKFRIIQETVDQALISPDAVVQITDHAEVPAHAVLPNIPLNIALGVIVGLIMGVGLAFFIEYLDTSVKTIDDVERALQAPVLGVIPQNVGTLIQEGPDSPHAEAYRVLRTNMLFSRKNPAANTITVVSGGAGEGKSTTIFNLATIFAQSGQRILIVDSDLRRPSLHKFLNISNAVGLTNYLLKQNTLEEVIQTTTLPTLNFLPSGKLPSSSMGILNSVAMKEFIQQVKERYDFVFFDSPPIMGVSDASILASEVDMALLVVQYRKYPQVMTIRAKQMVEKVGGNLLGVVLNNINISQDSYYYYYSGYYYDYYSKHDDDDSKKNGGSKKTSSSRGGVELKSKF